MIEKCANFDIHKTKEISRVCRIFLYVYFFISVFEPYLNGSIGSVTKYYIIVISIVLLPYLKSVKFDFIHLAYIAWIVYKISSLLWSENYTTPKLHFLSQVGMVAFLLILTKVKIDIRTIKNLFFCYSICSGVLGLLSIFYSKAYLGITSTRQVLVLFGIENDPNNQAALLLIGISVGLFNLFYSKEHVIISVIVILINTYACFITASRAGLITLIVLAIFLILFSGNNVSIRRKLANLMILAIVIIVIYNISALYLPDNITDRLFNLNTYSGGSERDVLWNNALKLFSRDFITILFGAGWGTATNYMGVNLGVHNTFLTMLCDVGLVGTMLFMIPIIITSTTLFRSKNMLPILVLISQFVPSFFIDAVNKRFFWNSIILMLIFYYNDKDGLNEHSDYVESNEFVRSKSYNPINKISNKEIT